MIYVFFAIGAIPTGALLWSIISLFYHRPHILKHELLAMLGAFMMFPILILYIGLMEIGVRWLVTLPGMVFGAVFLAGAAIFIRAEVHKARDRRIPPWGCPQCGYDRRGIDGPCPECGSVQPPDQPSLPDLHAAPTPGASGASKPVEAPRATS